MGIENFSMYFAQYFSALDAVLVQMTFGCEPRLKNLLDYVLLREKVFPG